MNLLLLLIVICGAGFALCSWFSSEFLRWMSAQLLTRADVIEAARKLNDQRRRFWRAELGVSENTGSDAREQDVPAALAR